MAEWAVVSHVADASRSWLWCPACNAVSRFDRVDIYKAQATTALRPFLKCPECDFQPYLPENINRTIEFTKANIILLDEQKGWYLVDPTARKETYRQDHRGSSRGRRLRSEDPRRNFPGTRSTGHHHLLRWTPPRPRG